MLSHCYMLQNCHLSVQLNIHLNIQSNMAAEPDDVKVSEPASQDTANLCTKILDFRGFDSSIILMLRGGIPRPIGNFPEVLSQRILAGRFFVGRFGVHERQTVCAGGLYLSPTMTGLPHGMRLACLTRTDWHLDRSGRLVFDGYTFMYTRRCL